MHKCNKCGLDKPHDEFYPRRDTKFGWSRICKACDKVRGHAKYEKFKDKYAKNHASYYRKNKQYHIDYCRDRRYRYKFGIGIAEYNELLEKQNGVCLICLKPPGKRNLAVDHDHQTNKIRGLLCTPCNQALGLAHDNPFVLLKAAEYLIMNQAIRAYLDTKYLDDLKAFQQLVRDLREQTGAVETNSPNFKCSECRSGHHRRCHSTSCKCDRRKYHVTGS